MNIIKLFFIFFLTGNGLLLSGCVNTSNLSYKKSISINECWFEVEDKWEGSWEDDRPVSECGILTVPENYSKPEGRKVKLPFIRFKVGSLNVDGLDSSSLDPDAPKKKALPLIVAGGGGPGSPLGLSSDGSRPFDVSLLTSWYASTIESGRDLILVDNRGVGSSVPRLDCFEVIEAEMRSLDKQLTVHDAVELTKDSLGLCRQRLVEQGIDLNQYHVINAANDLEALRIGLGLEQVNIYGFSYGSRVALVYEKMYPGSVRSLILDGVYPQTGRSLEDIPRVNYEAIKRIIDKCQENSQCMSQFGTDFENKLAAYLERLDKNSVTLSIKSPVNHEPIDVVVTPDVFFNSLYEMMYDHYSIASIPKYLYSAFDGNADHLTEMVRDYYVRTISIESIDVGAYASYSCFDANPFTDFDAARSELKKYPLQQYSNKYTIEVLKAMCDVWDVPGVSADFKDTYKIGTPVLIYSGELDPITPAQLARPVVDNASVSWSKVWPNISHGVIFNSDCADLTAAVFLDEPTSDPFVLDCADEVPEFNFDLM